MASTTTIAFVGAGIFAKEVHLPALHRIGANLKAVYSRTHASASSLQSEAQKLGFLSIDVYSEDADSGHSLEALLSRPDITAVLIALPILLQADVVRLCLAAGKHVLSEKPVAQDVAAARQLIHDHQINYEPEGLIFSVAEQFRYMEAYETARKWVVDEGLIGDVVHVHARIWRNLKPGGKYFETPWRKDPGYQAGWLLDGGVHHIALIRFVSGLEVVETKSFAKQVAEYLPPLDTVNAALRFNNGAQGSLSISFAHFKEATEYVFVGTRGSLTVTGKGPDTAVLQLQDASETIKEEIIESHGIDREILAFLEAVKVGKAKARAGPIEALNDVAIVESICSGGGNVQTL